MKGDVEVAEGRKLFLDGNTEAGKKYYKNIYIPENLNRLLKLIKHTQRVDTYSGFVTYQ